MPKEDGQFEVVLGNRQLLSILFIVVILLGVFFTMGYILGRNSAQPVEAAKQTEPPAEPPRASPAAPSPAGPPVAVPETATAPPDPTPGEAAPPPQTALPTPTPETEPAPGQTFLQVAAVKRTEAEIVADVLKKKGFRALIAPHPTADLFRVLVGPLAGPDEIAKTRAELEAAGFQPMIRKY
ncbi:MAG: SPOR domain-containing protein [Bryobacterales bacterium]|nr:SPOR domain-containing protein [Bryobacteraceae bacterium]MDW8355743.1 SPOR domain-containing protein [Bryobacterales bacterium]